MLHPHLLNPVPLVVPIAEVVIETEITFDGHICIHGPHLTILITTADGIESTNSGNIMICTRRLPLLKLLLQKVGGLFSTQSFFLRFILVLVLSCQMLTSFLWI